MTEFRRLSKEEIAYSYGKSLLKGKTLIAALEAAYAEIDRLNECIQNWFNQPAARVAALEEMLRIQIEAIRKYEDGLEAANRSDILCAASTPAFPKFKGA